MTDEGYSRLKALFLELCDEPGPERERRLARAAAGDPALRARLEALLARDRASAPAPPADPAGRALPGRIGDYQVLELLGEGGMGSVYLARQERPDRLVALKLLRPGPVTPERLRRFRLEVELLGRLQHPGIAQVLEGGTFESPFGPQPFFAMEFVRGDLLHEHVRARGLDVAARLALFVQVCEAVEHAHQNGVLHRDLKPGNILVDGSGQPRVLDFGLARALGEDLRPSQQTRAGELLGTLPYMSPEQLAGDPAAIGPASDVYALGVVGYELLAGRLPHDVLECPLPEGARRIREEEPAPLGTIQRAFRGDLDTIFAKALEKDPARRYPSAAALAADVRRHLRSEPIQARPPSSLYQLRKFAQRNRALVGAVAGALVLLAAGIVATARQAIRATEGWKRAEAEAAKATAVKDFLLGMVSAPDPAGLGREVKLADALAREAGRIGAAFAGEPEVQAELRQAVGGLYYKLGLLDLAEPELRAACELFLTLFGADDERSLRARQDLAETLRTRGRTEEAESILRAVLSARRRSLGDDHYATLITRATLAVTLLDRGDFAGAEAEARATWEARVRTLGAAHAATVRSQGHLAQALEAQGKFSAAEPLLADAARRSAELLGPEHPSALAARAGQAGALWRLGRSAEAEPVLREVLAKRGTVLGADHPDTLESRNLLALVLVEQGKTAEAAEHAEATVAARRRVLGAQHPQTLVSLNTLATILRHQGRLAEAEPILRELLDARRRELGPEHPNTLNAANNLGLALLWLDRLDESEPLLRETLETRGRTLGRGHPDTLTSLNNLALWHKTVGELAEAVDLLAECHVGRLAALGAEHSLTRSTARTLLGLYETLGKTEEAAALRRSLPSSP